MEEKVARYVGILQTEFFYQTVILLYFTML